MFAPFIRSGRHVLAAAFAFALALPTCANAQSEAPANALARSARDAASYAFSGAQDVAIYAAKVFRSLQPAHDIGGHELQVTASIGVSSYPRDAADGNGLLKCADAAMYRAKSQGGNRFEIFEADSQPPELDEQ